MAPFKEFAALISSSSSSHTSTTSLPRTLASLTSITHHDPETMAKQFLKYMTQAMDPSYTPADRGPMVFQFSIVTTILTTVAVALRFWGRKAIIKRWSSDDWAILVANGWMLASTILNCIGIHQGAIGKHLSDVVFLRPFSEMDHTQSTITFAIKLAFAYQLLYLITLLFIKLSLLLFYRRLLGPNTGGPLIPVIYATMGILVVYTVIAFFLLIFQCKPVRAYWTPEIHTMYCPSWERGLRRLYFGVLVVSVGSDFWVLGMPIFIVWKLNISGWKKLGCVVVFSLGTVACVAAAIRLYLVHTRPMYKDITWDFVLLVFWGQAEIATAIICACLPALKQLGQHTFQKIKTKSIHSSSSYTSGEPSSISRQGARAGKSRADIGEKTTLHQFLDSETKSIDLEKAMSGESSASTVSTSTTCTPSPRPLGDEASLTHIVYQYQTPAHPSPTLQLDAENILVSSSLPNSPTSPTSPDLSRKPLMRAVTASPSSSSSSSSVKSIGTFAASPIATTPKQAKSRIKVKEPKRRKGPEFEGSRSGRRGLRGTMGI